MQTTTLFKQAQKLVADATHILIIQAENPDGDSLGSALALEAIFEDMGKKASMYCAVETPKYLRHAKGWDRVVSELPKGFDLSIIVDTSSSTLLEKAFAHPNDSRITAHPILVIDHHTTETDLTFDFTMIGDEKAVATGELIFEMAEALDWPLPIDACDALAISIMADSLGLVTEATTARSIHVIASLVERGTNLSKLDAARRELMKKPQEILAYKGKLLQRIEYFLDGALAVVHIPWDEIEEYSDQYNPSVLVLDEMRLVEKVRLAVALKTYPDGKITGKIRANPDAKIAETVAGYFGGGGHPFAAGFKVYGESLENIKSELVRAVDGALNDRPV